MPQDVGLVTEKSPSHRASCSSVNQQLSYHKIWGFITSLTPPWLTSKYLPSQTLANHSCHASFFMITQHLSLFNPSLPKQSFTFFFSVNSMDDFPCTISYTLLQSFYSPLFLYVRTRQNTYQSYVHSLHVFAFGIYLLSSYHFT